MSGLVTDLYELTMAYAYWKRGMAGAEASFSLTFRENPFGGGFTVACGLAPAVEFLESLRFDDGALAYLETLRGNDGRALFSSDFLHHLGDIRFSCDVDAIPEGTVVFPQEPLVRVSGPLLEAQIVESALLNIINFQSLIATKAARVVHAARGDKVMEFGLRRAHGFDGALSASRAAYAGGCAATSHVLAGHVYGIPVAGTLAHSFIMAFDSEDEAFEAFAGAMPNNAILLVDTYDSLEGVRKAVAIGRKLREQGAQLAGIRLDSGDLAYLSIEARRILDEDGFAGASIAASNDLDEHLIESLKEQGAKIDLWGVGTRLVTAWDQPALGGVYKLNAIRRDGGAWEPRIKISEQVAKTSNPGLLRARRYARDGEYAGDVIYDELHPPDGDVTIVDPVDPTRRKVLPASASHEELLVPVMRKGKRVGELPALPAIRTRLERDMERFHGGIKRFLNPHRYPAGLEKGLYDRKMELILSMRPPAAL
ncbi:MAG: nicotinate phosphoribosyltransferase [Thermoanaerobaculia bacterium]